MPDSFGHTPVLVGEVVRGLDPAAGSVILDGTVGAGGHAEALLEYCNGGADLIGLDLDAQAMAEAGTRLARFGDHVRLVQKSFAEASDVVAALHLDKPVTHILLDLGISSMELEHSGRGFSFQREDEPLDMRFDAEGTKQTAAHFLNSAPKKELVRILTEYGEEPSAHAIAESIIQQRRVQPLRIVSDLVLAVQAARRSSHGRQSHLHPATRTFQALRIAVNDELVVLGRALPALLTLLAPGGRMAVISFHSLEDRIVKQFFKRESIDCICPPQFPECRCGHHAQLIILTKHVIVPGTDETNSNPRSRSAKLRLMQKIKNSITS